MPVTDLLERNHKLYSDEVALVELNPLVKDTRKTTWKEYDLVQQTSAVPYRREITWSIFDEKANRVANMLLSRGIRKGDRVAILMFNCLEWLPIYFGILKYDNGDINKKNDDGHQLNNVFHLFRMFLKNYFRRQKLP